MAPRHIERNVRRRGDDDYHSRMSYENGYIPTSLPLSPRPTDDDGDQHGPPPIATGKPTPGAMPPWASQYSSTGASVTSPRSTRSHQIASEPTIVATVTAIIPVVPIIPSQSASATVPFEGGSVSDTQETGPSNHGPLYATAAAVPIVVVAIIGFVVFCCIRKRRKQRQIGSTQRRVQEMKSQQPAVRAYMNQATPLSRAPSYTAPTHNMRGPMSPPPVILGPITAGSSGNYMTGIDTSDVMSTRNERTGLGDPFADGNSLHEEPPPPYKPRSLASRNSSLRIPRSSLSVSSQFSSHLQGQRSQPLQNPFEDPREDDVVSDLTGPTLHRNSDNVSMVSDLSYQQDAPTGRRAV